MKISMIPFGLLSGFMDSKEIRMLAAEERRLQENSDIFFREYSVKVEQKDYVQEVQRLAGEYSRYIRLKLNGDDGELAEALTGYPAELDEVHCGSLEEQKKLWFEGDSIKRNPDTDQNIERGSMCEELRTGRNEKVSYPAVPEKELVRNCGKYGNNRSSTDTERSFRNKGTELALELNGPSLYEEYLCQPLQDFLASYWQKNYLTHSWLAGRTPERFYIGNQFCHNLFPTENQLFSIMDKMRSEDLEVTLAFSYIREFMLSSVEKLLEKVDNWCCVHGVNVEIVVNDWAMVEILRGKTSHLSPVFGTLLNKRKKDPRMKYKFHIHRYEWESCGYPQEFPPGKNSIHLPFYQTNTSQYCPLYALCTTGDRGMQQLAEHCPKFCEKYALLYPEHLHMIGRYNSLFGVDKTLLETPEMWKKIKGIKPDRIVVNL